MYEHLIYILFVFCDYVVKGPLLPSFELFKALARVLARGPAPVTHIQIRETLHTPIIKPTLEFFPSVLCFCFVALDGPWGTSGITYLIPRLLV